MGCSVSQPHTRTHTHAHTHTHAQAKRIHEAAHPAQHLQSYIYTYFAARGPPAPNLNPKSPSTAPPQQPDAEPASALHEFVAVRAYSLYHAVSTHSKTSPYLNLAWQVLSGRLSEVRARLVVLACRINSSRL